MLYVANTHILWEDTTEAADPVPNLDSEIISKGTQYLSSSLSLP